MISVQNHLLQLSGNKWLLLLCGVMWLAGCSPKVQPTTTPPAQTDVEKKPPVTAPVTEKPVKPVVAKTSVVSLILPFSLNNLNGGYSSTALKQANVAIDYYQGFKLALDSLTAYGYNYELHVYDSQGSAAQSHSLAYNSQIRVSDLIVGPIFPDDMKAFADVLTSARNPIVSPLSPAAPSTIKNQNLVTVIPPLEYHIKTAANYAVSRYKPKKIFILSSGFSEDNEYIRYFKRSVDSLTQKKVQIVQITVSRGDLSAVIPQLSVTGQNIFVIPSTNQQFLMVTLGALEKLSTSYPITLFGHPNWQKFSYLKAEQLQKLNTHITNADKVDYKAAATNTFLRNYRKVYKIEPSEYAIKGFDEGLYFGKLLANSTAAIKPDLEKTDFIGIHNKFHFVRLAGMGWVNTYVDVLKYANFELKRVE